MSADHDAPWRLDAVALLEAYRTGRLTPSEACAATLERIRTLRPALGAYSALATDVERLARDSDERWRRGAPVGALDGVPLVVKDNLRQRGLPASWGNSALALRVCDGDERPVARLRAAGALLLGKANVPEFAIEGYVPDSRFGVARNPFDPTLTPGSSSGGLAAAIAAGLATAGIATDGGGSIRRPAGYCGLVGLKPGAGTVARGDGLPSLLLDFEVVGPVARSVRDVRLLLRVLRGERTAVPASCPGSSTVLPAASRVLVVTRIGDAPVDPLVVDATRRAAAVLERLGLDAREGPLPLDTSGVEHGWGRLAEIGLARLFESDPAIRSTAADTFRQRAARGRTLPATVLHELLDAVGVLRTATASMFERTDLVLAPSSAAMPWPVDAPYPTDIDGTPVGPRGHAPFTAWVNAVGRPALALPAPVDVGALPVGVQLIADLGHEDRLLALGERYEADVGGFRWPDLPATAAHHRSDLPSRDEGDGSAEA